MGSKRHIKIFPDSSERIFLLYELTWPYLSAVILMIALSRPRNFGTGKSKFLLISASLQLTNISHSQHHPEDVAAALDICLEQIGTEYLDVCFHYPLSDLLCWLASFIWSIGPLPSNEAICYYLSRLLAAPIGGMCWLMIVFPWWTLGKVGSINCKSWKSQTDLYSYDRAPETKGPLRWRCQSQCSPGQAGSIL
jgi:hypothetical protein